MEGFPGESHATADQAGNSALARVCDSQLEGSGLDPTHVRRGLKDQSKILKKRLLVKQKKLLSTEYEERTVFRLFQRCLYCVVLSKDIKLSWKLA